MRASRPPRRRKANGLSIRAGAIGEGKRGRGASAVPAKKNKPKAGRPERLAHELVGSRQHRRQLLAEAAGRQPASAELGIPESGEGTQALRTPDWLDHMLTVTGPADTLAAFRVAASGPGGLPFHCNSQLEEDWIHLLLSPPLEERGISVEGARILAARLRERVESRAQAELEMRQTASCSLDLQALLPVPPSLLRLGPNDPRVLDWLWVHWGTTWPLRHVSAEPLSPAGRKMLPAGHDGICYQFWSADWTPWRALDAIRNGWPDLALTVVVHYGEASLTA